MNFNEAKEIVLNGGVATVLSNHEIKYNKKPNSCFWVCKKDALENVIIYSAGYIENDVIRYATRFYEHQMKIDESKYSFVEYKTSQNLQN